jgi:transcriptional regulator with XRE-family HTH domain
MKTKVCGMIAKIFGEILRELRLNSNISQEELAGQCNLDRTYISLLERGLRQPSLETILKISKALKISAALMVGQVEKIIKS